MSGKREAHSAAETLELVLTLLAVIAGSVAATGAFLGASYERDRVALEKRPAVLLSCEPEFHALDAAEGTRPPTNTVLLTARGARWIHIVSDGRGNVPQPFARCALTSYGQLPVFNLRVALKLEMLDQPGKESKAVDSSFDVPGLSPSQPYPFGLINANGTVVRIRDFLYAPKSLYVRTNQIVTFINDDAEAHTVTGPAGSFDSGTIDPRAEWRHLFSRPGTYYYTCSFHPYMHGRIIVSK